LDKSQYKRIYWISSSTPDRVVVEPINFDRYKSLLDANLIRVVPDDIVSKPSSDEPGDSKKAASSSEGLAQIEALYKVEEFFAIDDEEDTFGDCEEEETIPDQEAYPSWWAQKKQRPEVIVVPNANVPDGVMLLIKRHFSESITPLAGKIDTTAHSFLVIP